MSNPVQASFHPIRFFTETWKRSDERIELGPNRAQAVFQARVALLTSTVVLALFLSVGLKTGLAGRLDLPGIQFFLWWCGSNWLFLVLLPACVARRYFGVNPLDYGCRLKDARGHGRLYLVTLVVALGATGVASHFGGLTSFYPFFQGASRSWADLLLWELIYGLQFVAIEFFFRGFMLRACEPALGSLAIFAMIGPYCLIHMTKPWPEFFASIAAGLVLGTLALRTRSIWGGVLLHLSIAWSMDLLALLHQGKLPSGLLP